MAEDTNKVNPADLVPFVENPDVIPRLTKEQAEQELGIKYPDGDYEGMFNGFAELRSLVDSIPTPTADEGSPLGSFSAFSIVKDVLGGTLGLMEAPLKGAVTEEVFENTLKMGAGATGLNLARVGTSSAVGMFGSRPSIMAGKKVHEKFNAQLKEAEHMQSIGDPEEKIFQQTGMTKDHRGNWRYSVVENIDDPGQARIDWEHLDVLNDTNETVLGRVLKAPKAYEHWPELAFVKVVTNENIPNAGSYNPITNTIIINKRILENMTRYDDPNTVLKVLVHEAQHALQLKQDRPQGAGPDWVAQVMDERINSFKKWMVREKDRAKTNTELAAIHKFEQVTKAWERMQRAFSREMAAYWASPGEIEARLAEVLATNPKFGSVFPEDFNLMNKARIPDKQNRFEPADIQIPSAEPGAVTTGPTDKKTFGTKQN